MSSPGPEPSADVARMPTPGRGVIARNFVALGIGEILSRLIGFASTLWVARQLGIDGYGVIGFAFTITMYAAAVTDFGLKQQGPREIALHRADPGPLIASVGAARVLIGLALAALMAGGGLLVPAPDGHVLLLFGLTLIPEGGSMRWLHIGLQRSSVASAARVAGESLRLAILLLLVHTPGDILIVPLAQLAGDAVATTILITAIRRSERVNLRVDPALAFTVLRRALPLLLTNLLGYVIYNSDVILLRIARPVAEVGLYLAAYAPINLLGVFGGTIALSLIPGLAEPGRDRRSRQSIVDSAVQHVMAFVIPLAVGGMLLARPLITLAFGADYAPAGTVLAVLIWTFPLLLMRSVHQAALIAADARGDVLRTTAWAAGLNVALNLIVVPLIGMVGAAATTLGTEVLRLGLALGYARKAGYRLPAPVRFLRVGAASLLMGAIVLALSELPIWALVPCGALAYVLALGLFGGIRRGAGGGFIR